MDLNCRKTRELVRITCFKSCLVNNAFPRQYYKQLRKQKLPPNCWNLRRVTKAHIESCHETLNQFHSSIDKLSSNLDEMNLVCRIKFFNFTRTVCERTRKQTALDMQSSINCDNPNEAFPKSPEKYVTNLSDLHLNKLQNEALSLGFKYSVPPCKISRIHIESQFENLCSQLTNLQASSTDYESWFETKCVDLANQYITTPPKHCNVLTHEHQNALKELMINNQIVILRPDKGSGVVILNKSDYITKMKDILSDKTRFLCDEKGKGMTLKTKNQVLKALIQLLSDGIIDRTLHTSLRPRGSNLPRMYGLPKVHKKSIPLRPILEMSKYQKPNPNLQSILKNFNMWYPKHRNISHNNNNSTHE